jgi:hypothetical protein
MTARTVTTLPAAATHDVAARCLLAIELSKKNWVVAVTTPLADKISRHTLKGFDWKGLERQRECSGPPAPDGATPQDARAPAPRAMRQPGQIETVLTLAQMSRTKVARTATRRKPSPQTTLGTRSAIAAMISTRHRPSPRARSCASRACRASYGSRRAGRDPSSGSCASMVTAS